MFKSLVVLGSLFAGYVSGAKVTPVTVVYDKMKSATVTDITAEIGNATAAGATRIVIGWYNPGPTSPAAVAGTALETWISQKTYDAINGIADPSMGINYSTWSSDVANIGLIEAANTVATDNKFKSMYWDVEAIPSFTQADVDFIAKSLAASVTMPVYLTAPAAYFSTAGPFGSVSLKGAIEAAYASPVDPAKLAGIVVQYYNSGADFSTLDSMLIAAPTAAAGSAIAELNTGVTQIKNKFSVGKLMKATDNLNQSPPATDFTPLADLDTIMCQAQNFDAYTQGLTLYAFYPGDETLLTPAIAADCAGVTTPAPTTSSTAPTATTTTTKASGSGATLMISSVAVAAGLVAIMN